MNLDHGEMDQAARLAAVGELLARAILRKRRGDPPASKSQLPRASHQSETCARETGLLERMPGAGAGRTGLADHSRTGDEA